MCCNTCSYHEMGFNMEKVNREFERARERSRRNGHLSIPEEEYRRLPVGNCKANKIQRDVRERVGYCLISKAQSRPGIPSSVDYCCDSCEWHYTGDINTATRKHKNLLERARKDKSIPFDFNRPIMVLKW